MSLRLVRGVVGVVAVAGLLLAAAPAQAWLGGAKTGDAAERPVWAAVWQGVVDLWVAAQEALGLQGTVAATEADATPCRGTEVTGQDSDPASRQVDGQQGVGVDPDGCP